MRTAQSDLISQSREIWVDGIEDPVAVQYHLAEPDGNHRDWVALKPGYWTSEIKEKIFRYTKATHPELFRKKRVPKPRTPPVRDAVTGKFKKKEVQP